FIKSAYSGNSPYHRQKMRMPHRFYCRLPVILGDQSRLKRKTPASLMQKRLKDIEFSSERLRRERWQCVWRSSHQSEAGVLDCFAPLAMTRCCFNAICSSFFLG